MNDVPHPADEAAALRAEIFRLVERYAQVAHGERKFDPATSPVPVNGKVYGAAEMVSLVDSALEFWLTTGRFNDAFEAGLGKVLGSRYVLTVNSGSSANLVAVSALTSHMLGEAALKPGDEVITCATGFPTTVNPILQNGLVPVFLDVEIPTYNIRAELIEAAVTEKTRAIVVAHTLGNPFELDTVMAVAKKHNLFVVEDCCDALGGTYKGAPVGSFGDIGTLSFYPAHHITTGEGGAVFTRNSTFKRITESVRDWGRDCWCAPGKDNTCQKRFGWQLGGLPAGYDHKFTYSHLGYNLKMTDMQAAIGLAQLDRLQGFIAARKDNFKALYAGLSRFGAWLILPEATAGSDPSWFGFPITVRADAPFTRDALVRHLNQARIGTRYLFGGNLVHQPYMAGRNFRVFGETPNADLVMTNTFWVGVYPGIGEMQLEYMLETFEGFFRQEAAF
jgi:CDP-6-deoxy-D-xylo-4-hexulose-3-dehydrase